MDQDQLSKPRFPWWITGFLGLATAVAATLGTALWSARRQRPTTISADTIGPLEENFRTLEALTESWLVEGNEVTVLQDGDGFFPALLAAIDSAEHNVHVETFAWWRGPICRTIAEALAEKATDGVDVRIVVDAIGSSSMEPDLEELMAAAGCRLVKYHQARIDLLGRINKRDHRKLAVIDGRTAFVMGHGFGREWEGAGDGPESWRDTAARLEGPIVARAQSIFAQHWMEEIGEPLTGEDVFPPLESAGSTTAHLVSSSPRGGVSSVSILYRYVIAAARREILIQNPYFCPGHEAVDLLVAAAHREVEVRIMLPGHHTDSPVTRHAGHHHFARLLEAGIEIWEHRLTVPHQKVLVVDGIWSHIGSTNFDRRSFDINAEISLGVLGHEIADELRAAFEDDLRGSERITAEAWARRPWSCRLADRLAFLIHEQL